MTWFRFKRSAVSGSVHLFFTFGAKSCRARTVVKAHLPRRHADCVDKWDIWSQSKAVDRNGYKMESCKDAAPRASNNNFQCANCLLLKGAFHPRQRDPKLFIITRALGSLVRQYERKFFLCLTQIHSRHMLRFEFRHVRHSIVKAN